MELSLVIPSYNQAKTIAQEIAKIDAFLKKFCESYEIILVIDSDKDNTLKAVNNLNIPNLRIECFKEHRGKGASVKHGFDIAQGKYRLMVDLIQFTNADIIIGSKRHYLSQVTYPPIRRIYSFGYQLINRLLFNLKISDTQVGLKIFKHNVAKALLPHTTTEHFAFDLELLVIANELQFNHIIEAPVKINYNFTSSIKIKILLDTWNIFYKARISKKLLKKKGKINTNIALTKGVSITISEKKSIMSNEQIPAKNTR